MVLNGVRTQAEKLNPFDCGLLAPNDHKETASEERDRSQKDCAF